MNKVIKLSDRQQEFKNTDGATINKIYPGFSHRLNFIIDLTDLNIPPIDGGRISTIAKITGSSKPAVSDWLSKNKPPKDGNQDEKQNKTTLYKLVTFFIQHISFEIKPNPLRVIAWLRYGDEAVPSPFQESKRDVEGWNQEIIPLATNIIVEEAKALNIQTSSFDLKKVLNDTVKTLIDFMLYDYDNVEQVHRIIIQQYIRKYIR